MKRLVTLAATVAVIALLAPPTGSAAVASSPFGLYQHLQAPDFSTPNGTRETTSNYVLVTVRGDADAVTGSVGDLLANRGTTSVVLYRRGTAVSDADAAAFQKDHPEWLARDSSGKVVTSNAGGDVIDITNPAVRQWLTTGIAKTVAAGHYNGVYLDVLGAFFSPAFYSTRPVISGSPLADTAWRDASVALIKEVKAATGVSVIANGFGLQSGTNYSEHAADADQLIDAADGIQIEQFVRNGNAALDKFKPVARWQQDVDLVRAAGTKGKIVLADTRVRDGSDAGMVGAVRDYAVASFLIAAAGPARFRFAVGETTGTSDTSVGQWISALGPPKADAAAQGKAQVRDFAGGGVAVNPSDRDVSVHVDGATRVLPAHAGVVSVGGNVVSGTAGPTAVTGRAGRKGKQGKQGKAGQPGGSGGSSDPVSFVEKLAAFVGIAAFLVGTGIWLGRRRRATPDDA